MKRQTACTVVNDEELHYFMYHEVKGFYIFPPVFSFFLSNFLFKFCSNLTYFSSSYLQYLSMKHVYRDSIDIWVSNYLFYMRILV
jgi:hypothetical protein